MEGTELYDWESELELSQKILGLAKEHLGEDNVREISCNGNIDTVLIRIRNEIDPFYLKVDNPDDVRTSGDLGEEDRKLPKGDFGDYCARCGKRLIPFQSNNVDDSKNNNNHDN